MKKKMAAIIVCALCAAFAVCALAGCGGGGGDKASGNASGGASGAAASSAKAAAELPGAEIGQPDGWKVDVVTPDQEVMIANEKNASQVIDVKYNPASSGKAEKYISLGAENDEKEMKTTTINGNTWYYFEGFSGLNMAVDLSDGRLVVTADGLTLDEATPVLELIKIS